MGPLNGLSPKVHGRLTV